jgi:GTP-binding protein
MEQTFDLFDRLGATDEQLDFPVLYASAIEGWASPDPNERDGGMEALFRTIVERVPAPKVDGCRPLQMQVSALDYSSYVGVIGVARIRRGRIRRNTPVAVAATDGTIRRGRILQILAFHGLQRVELDEAEAGDIVAFTGVDGLKISDTICDPDAVEPLPPLLVDEPTISMTFQVNDSPFGGREGKYVSSRNLRERLAQELIHNVALRVQPTGSPDKFKVSGRGELHLAILIENMRREGYELAISRPEVILKTIDGEPREPWETLTVDVEEQHQGAVMERLGERRGELKEIAPDGRGRVRLDYLIPTRGLIGFRSEFLTVTSGTGLIYHAFECYGPRVAGDLGRRVNGALVSMATGRANAYALWSLQDRGRLFVAHNTEIYEGMIVGIHARGNDLAVNPLKTKQLTNFRAAGSDENILLTPPIATTLEFSLEFINDDELVEVTPRSIRIRKKVLKEHERKKASRAA